MSRSIKGSIIAEHSAALIVLFLCLMFPLFNLATIGYRYGFLVQACHNGAHAGATSSTFSSGSSSSAVMDAIPAVVNNFLNHVSGISNRQTTIRLVQTSLANHAVTRHANGARLTQPLPNGYILSVECTVNADIDPLVPFKGGLVPKVPGMTMPIKASVTARELLENPSGMNR